MKALIKLIFSALVLVPVAPLAVATLAPVSASASAPTVSADELEAQVREKIASVPEFKFISEYAKKNGVRVWLFGGTAASFAHYAKWDLLREKGDPRFQPDRFDYDYTNIYRSNQDLDIVLDAPSDKVYALQSALAAKFPHLQGQKSAWEVRLLREGIGDKEAILGNPEFSNQHTDSHSVGMIELTPSQTEPVIRDLRDWSNARPAFLDDVLKSRLHYYFSPLHSQTARAKKGLNPPIISAIRYYIKAFQFELAMDPKEEPVLRQIISQFDPAKMTDYERRWIEKNAPKLFQNAVNIEYAWNVLERNGLRQKLLKVGTVQSMNSVAWWMNKEPLRSTEVGHGNGQTAEQLGISIVAHETNSFEAYESITRAHTGDPNVLISRDKTVGEAAVYGDGFYTQIGKNGARGTRITIRFTVDPKAREGVDFIKSGTYLIFRNKRALRVIPESLNWGFREYIAFLMAGQIDANERAMLEKLKRRIAARMAVENTEEDLKWFDDIIRDHLREKSAKNGALLKAWFEYRKPFDRQVDEKLLSSILLSLKESRSFDTILRDIEPPKSPVTLRFDVYLELLSEIRDLEKSKVATYFVSPQVTTKDLLRLGQRIKSKGYPGELVAREWFTRAFVSDLPTSKILEVLPKISGTLHSFLNGYEELDPGMAKHGARTITYAEYLDLLRLMPDHGRAKKEQFDSLRKLFVPAEPTTEDLADLKGRIERAPKKYDRTWQPIAFEWLDRAGPLVPETNEYLKNENFRYAFQSWLYDSEKKFDITLEQAFDLLDRDYSYARDMDRRMRITLRKADFELLRSKFLSLDKLHSAAHALIIHNFDKIPMSPVELVAAYESSTRYPFNPREPEREELFVAIRARLLKLNQFPLEDFLKFVEVHSKRERFYANEIADLEKRVVLDKAAVSQIDRLVMKGHAVEEVARSQFRLWMRAHEADLATQSSRLLELFAKDEIGRGYARDFVVANAGLPAWAESNYEYWKLFSLFDHEITDAALKRIDYIQDPARLRRIIELVPNRLQQRILLNVFSQRRSTSAELLLLAVEKYESYSSYDWEAEQALESWKKDPRIKQVLSYNSLLKRKVTIANLKMAIKAERAANLASKPRITKRVFGVRSCEALFVR